MFPPVRRARSGGVFPFPPERVGLPHSKEADVERINQFEYYQLGGAFDRLKRHDGDVKLGDVVFDLWAAQSSLNSLVLDAFIPLGVCREAAQALKSAIDAFDEEYFYVTKADGKREVSLPSADAPVVAGWEWRRITVCLERFETIYAAELREAATYYVPRRGIFWTPALIDSAEETFPEDLRKALSEKAKNEWRAAGRCLAFQLLSASGFHVARAVEAVLEEYFQYFCAKPGVTHRGWHDYIEALRGANGTPKPTEKTITELDQMRDDYRNPIMHPRIVLNENEARILFANGESLIMAMLAELVAAKKTHPTVQPELAVVGGKSA